MSESEPGDDLIDRVVERVMLGQDPDVEALISGTPDLSPATREKLRKVADVFGSSRLGALVPPPREAPLPFAELGPYTLLSRMGEGGMGVVYLAEHRFLRRRVALKIIRPEFALSQVTRQRFHREAMSIAKLRHANIVSVYDAGEHDGVAYLAMEVVEGQGLDELLQAAGRAGQQMDVIAAVRHARGIALALQCAHDAGIIHRDVKPSNVRITPDGRELLLDFGLSLEEEMASLSNIGQLSGTPQYASPEQIETGSAEIDGRTDVYSLGVTLYECLTGRLPFVGSTMTQLFHQILTSDPIEPRELNDRVDDALNGIVMRAIAKRREDRFESAGAMAGALEEWLQRADHARPTERAKPAGGRKILAAALLLALVGAGWLVLRGAGGPQGSGSARATSAQPTRPVARPTARNTTALLGAPDLALDQRLNPWDPLIGSGTFGADLDGPGVIGTCVDGITGKPHVLPGGNGSVSGSIEPIASRPGERTLGAGAAIEFSNGRIVALFLISAADGYDLRLCELSRDENSGLVRGTDIDSSAGKWRAGEPMAFRLSWNDSDTQFDWGDAGNSAASGSFLLPRELRDTAQPSRLLLIVQKGSARFEGLVLEEF